MEDGVYLLPGETAERIETAGMYQQLDLFSMFTEQAGNLAMKQAETVTPIRSETKIPPEQIADIPVSYTHLKSDSRRSGIMTLFPFLSV